MKTSLTFKRVACALLATAAVGAIADPVADLAAGTNLNAKCTNGTFTYTIAGFGQTLPLMPSPPASVSKAAGSLNCTANLGTLFPQFGVSASLVMTGTNLGGGKLKWSLTAPSLVGQTVAVHIGPNTVNLTVSAVGGTLQDSARTLADPILDSFAGIFRTVSFYPNTSTSGLLIKGKVNGTDASLLITPIVAGIGGVAATQFVDSITFSQTNLLGGASTAGHINLHAPAGSAGLDVAVGAVGPISIPVGTVHVNAGATTALFTINSSPVSSLTPAMVRAGGGGFYTQGVLNITPLLFRLTFDSLPHGGGDTLVGTVLLNGPAPAGGTHVTLFSEDVNVIIPGSVTVAQGQTSAQFPIVTVYDPKTTNIPVTIIAATGATAITGTLMVH